MSYIIAPLDKVKDTFPEFRQSMSALQDAVIKRAQDIWAGFTFGGLTPGSRQFGLTTMLPREIFGKGTQQWTQTFSAPGSWTNIFSYSVPVDEIHGFAGFAFTEPTLIFSQLRWEIKDRKFPIINVEESRAFNVFAGGFVIVVKADAGQELIAEERTQVLVKGFQERGSSGIRQRIIPIGLLAFRRIDLVITEEKSSVS